MNRFGLAALLASVALPAWAADVLQPVILEEPAAMQPRISGHVEAYVGGVWVDFDGEEEEFLAYGGTGRLNFPINERWNIQGDLFADRISEDDFDATGYGAAAHAYWRNPNSYALGVFGSWTTYDVDFGGGDEGEADSYMVGPEAQFYAGNWTIYGQVWYGEVDLEGAPFEVDLLGARGVVRYYATPNLRFDGELAFERADLEFFDTDTVSLAAQAMYRFDGMPLSVFARYQYDRTSLDSFFIPVDFETDSHKVIVGLRATFGAPTLLDEDRGGATMDTYRRNLVLPSALSGGSIIVGPPLPPA